MEQRDSRVEARAGTVQGDGQPHTQPQATAAPGSGATTNATLDKLDIEGGARLRQGAGPTFLYATLRGVFPEVSPAAVLALKESLLADAGSPSDPIEIMLIEQIVSAHMNIGRLQFRSVNTETLEVSRTFGSMAMCLLAEFRRLCLALQSYRVTARQLRTPASVDKPTRPPSIPAGTAEAETGSGTELGSKEEQIDAANTVIPFTEEPEACGGRQEERSAPKRAVG